MESVKDVFAAEELKEVQELHISPELIDKVKNAFLALEEVLAEAFPTNKLITRVLIFLATYVNSFLK